VQHAGIREFRDHATRYLAGDDIVAVQRHGHTVGFYFPVQAKRDEAARQAMARLGEAVDHLLEETGLSEDELVETLSAPVE
jgi:hypothetical protein